MSGKYPPPACWKPFLECEGEHLKTFFRIGILFLAASHLFGPFLPFDAVMVMSLAAATVFVTGFTFMSGAFKKASLVFVVAGAAMLAHARQTPAAWMRAFASMSNIVAIVAVMQTFTIPIRLGEYDVAIRSWLDRRFKTPRALFLFTTVVTNLLNSFLSLGCIPVIVSLFEDALRRRISNYERFLASAMSRGYVLTALWSPGAVNLYLVAQATGLPWSVVFVPGLVLSLLGMALSFALETWKSGLLDKDSRGADMESAGCAAAEPAFPAASGASATRVWQILLVAAIIILVILTMEKTGIGTSANRIILAGACVSFGWIVLLSRRPGLSVLARRQWNEGLMKAADVGPFFVAMGVFSAGLESSGLLESFAPALYAVTNSLGAASVVLIGALIIVGSLIGLHPFITIVLFGKMLVHAGLPVPMLTIALGLSVGGAAAYMISPFAGIIMTVSKQLGVKPYDVAVRWNWRFSILFFAVGIVFAFAWGACFG